MQIKNPSLLDKLKKAGFSDKDSLVYVSLLELGGAFPSRIAEYSSLKRSTVYNILQSLSIRGIINEIEKKNKLFYQIDKPEKIIRYAERQIINAKDTLESAQKIIPDIEGLYENFIEKPKVTYFEGEDGIVTIYTDMITDVKKYEMLAFSNAAQLEHVFPTKFFEKFRRTKENLGITTRGIVPDTESDREYNKKFFTGYKEDVVPKLRYISSQLFPFKGEITIYADNRVAIVNLNKEYLTGLIIEDQTIHDMLKLIFELSWNSTLIKK